MRIRSILAKNHYLLYVYTIELNNKILKACVIIQNTSHELNNLEVLWISTGPEKKPYKSKAHGRAKANSSTGSAAFGYHYAAILAADVVGYSRLMETWEIQTYKQLRRLRKDILDPGIEARQGRIVKNTGDGFLAIFDDAHLATDCALYLQKAVVKRTQEQAVDQRINFRMAINLAEFIIDDEDIHGDGVNIAARLQTYAPAGGIVVSEAVAERVMDAFDVNVIDLGELHLRNIEQPVRVFELRIPTAAARLVGDAMTGSEQRPSIAVLPFRMHMTGPDEAYFADGVVDDIIHGLASLKDLFVVSRGSALGYGGAAPDMKAVGRQLGVRYALYGSVQRAGGRLRIRTELSDTETGNVIDTRQYEGKLDDIFELQDRIAFSVIKSIAPHIQERELTRARRKHPQDMTAYDLVLQALDLLYRMDYESFCRARGLLQQAISHDPSYAPAYYHAAIWHVARIAEIGSSDPGADIDAAVVFASAAVERDRKDAEALSTYGHVQSRLLRNYDTAAKFFDLAIEAGPSLAMAWSWSSLNLGYLGNGKAAVEQAEQGVRLSPLDVRSSYHEGSLAQAHYIDGNYEAALQWACSAAARNPTMRFNLRVLIATLVALGRNEESEQEVRRLLRIQPNFRLRTYAANCPFEGAVLDNWIKRLKAAGIPE